MKTIRKVMMIAVAAAGLAASSVNVMAQPAPGTGPGAAGGPGMMGGQGMMGGRGAQRGTPEQHDARMREHFQRFSTQLHDKLKLNASQEQAWNTYLQAMTPAPRGQRPDRAQWESMTAPQRMEQHLARMKEREAQLSKRLDATRTFYAVLSPEQQKVFNAETAHPFKGMQGERMHRGQGGRVAGPQGAPGSASAPQQR